MAPWATLPAFGVNAFGVRLLLATRGDDTFYATAHMKPSSDVKALPYLN